LPNGNGSSARRCAVRSPGASCSASRTLAPILPPCAPGQCARRGRGQRARRGREQCARRGKGAGGGGGGGRGGWGGGGGGRRGGGGKGRGGWRGKGQRALRGTRRRAAAGGSPGRRCGPPWLTRRTGRSAWLAPTPRHPNTAA